jgi:hypothetical protein
LLLGTFSSAEWNNRRWFNNRVACEEAGFTWYEKSLHDILNVSYPECARTGFSRVNQLGNAFDSTVAAEPAELGAPDGVNANRYMWRIPKIPDPKVENYFDGDKGNGMVDAYKSCTLRIRYNISTSDFPAWPPEALPLQHQWRGEMVTAANNSKANDYSNTPLTQDPCE